MPESKKRWASAAEAVRDFKFRHNMKPSKMSILSAVWEKEMGSWVNHWNLVGLKRGVLYVSPKSSAAAQELQMRSGSVINNLNKYFSSAWIKTIKANSTWPPQEEKIPSAA